MSSRRNENPMLSIIGYIWSSLTGMFALASCLLGGIVINMIIFDDSPSGHYDFNIFKDFSKKGKILAAIFIGIIFPPSLVITLFIGIITAYYNIHTYVKKKFKLGMCKAKVYPDGNVHTRCGAHVSSLAIHCPICKKEINPTWKLPKTK